eukprot:SAG11_NODE_1556_length_4688_cov_7.338636_4_plen_71_part_00
MLNLVPAVITNQSAVIPVTRQIPAGYKLYIRRIPGIIAEDNSLGCDTSDILYIIKVVTLCPEYPPVRELS